MIITSIDLNDSYQAAILQRYAEEASSVAWDAEKRSKKLVAAARRGWSRMSPNKKLYQWYELNNPLPILPPVAPMPFVFIEQSIHELFVDSI